MNRDIRKPLSKRSNIKIEEFKTPPRNRKQSNITIGDVKSPPIRRKQSNITIGDVKSPPIRRKQSSITIEEFRTPPRTQKQSSLAIEEVKMPTRTQKSNITIGEVDSPLISRKQSMIREEVKLSPRTQRQSNITIGEVDSPIISRKRSSITIGEFQTPPRTQKKFLVEMQNTPPTSFRQHQKISIEMQNTPPTTLRQHQKISIGSLDSPILSEERQAELGDWNVGINPPAYQPQGLCGGLYVLRQIKEARQTQTRFGVNVNPKDVTFISGVNNFSDEHFKYMIRVNDGETDLSLFSSTVRLQICSFDVSPIPSFKLPLFLANVEVIHIENGGEQIYATGLEGISAAMVMTQAQLMSQVS